METHRERVRRVLAILEEFGPLLNMRLTESK